MALPNEHIFKKVHANAERMLEHQVLGWMSQPLENVTSDSYSTVRGESD